MGRETEDQLARRGRVAALILAGVGVFWIAATFIGSALDWSNNLRLLFDMLALVGFIMSLVMIFQLWRARQNSKD